MMPRLNAVVIEGPDASGKGTLIDYIQKEWPTWMTEERAADSLTGPRGHLDAWVEKAETAMFLSPTPLLYDRHPLISEPIYGPTVRGCMDKKNPRTDFNDVLWLQDRLDTLRESALVIFCLPPLENILKNLADTPNGHMPGVQENATKLYWMYHAVAAGWAKNGYIYDYTQDQCKNTVVRLIKSRVNRLP